jgi:hypothetical protein
MEEIFISITDTPDNITVNIIDNVDQVTIGIVDTPTITNVTVDEDIVEQVNITVVDPPVETINIHVSEGYQGPQGPPGVPPVITFNIEVEDLPDGSTITHPLASWKLAVLFFDSNGRQIFNIDWEVVDQSNIKIYLPTLDGELVPFIGDIFIINRNQIF